MKEILISIKNIFKYGKKTILFTWLFFFILAESGDSPHPILVRFLLAGVFTVVIVIMAAVMRYLKLL